MLLKRAVQPQLLSAAEKRYAKFAPAAYLCGAVAHFLIIFVFSYIGLRFMAYFNMVSVSVFLLSFFFIRRGMILLSALLPTIEVILHAGLAVYFLGWGSGFQYYLFVLPIIGFFYPGKRFSVICTLCSAFSFFVLIILFSNGEGNVHFSAPVLIYFYAGNVLVVITILSIFAYTFSRVVAQAEDKLQIQYERAENLLQNILPQSVAERLKNRREIIADGFTQASILFADIQNFTEFSARIKPSELVGILNGLFSAFDDLIEPCGVEKIKTIGDAYMVASGLPETNGRHAEQILNFAVAMLSATQEYNQKHDLNFFIRIGINSGPVVAGVIGKKKYIYDLWGDAVNIASRMEASGAPGQIHITESTFQLIKGKYDVIKRNPIEIKGKGLMQTYFIKLKDNSSVHG